MLNPLGYYVLIKVASAEEVTSGGIVLPGSLVEKEQMIEETGEVVAFGPTAYRGMQGCTLDDVKETGKPAHELWGVKVGDRVEFKRYEGKTSYVDGFENHRYIPDTHIMGVISNG
jgi:chaperonin GroES